MTKSVMNWTINSMKIDKMETGEETTLKGTLYGWLQFLWLDTDIYRFIYSFFPLFSFVNIYFGCLVNQLKTVNNLNGRLSNFEHSQ